MRSDYKPEHPLSNYRSFNIELKNSSQEHQQADQEWCADMIFLLIGFQIIT